MTEKNIPIIGIQRLRIGSDGQGIRTLVGTAGCSLRCRYCLNPHSWDLNRYTPKLVSPEHLYEIVSIDNLYFQATNGGITFGGGEPLMHMDGIGRFKKLCPSEWSIWTETSLNVSEKQIVQAAHIFDHFIIDIKTTNPAIYKKYTSGDFEVMYGNLKKLLSLISPEKISVRIPIIPGYTEETDQKNAVDEISALGISDIEVFSYKTNMGK